MITLTPSAEKAAERFIKHASEPVTALRMAVASGGCSGFEYKIALVNEPDEGDLETSSGNVKIYVDPASAPYLNGVTVDFFETLTDSGFKFENPNAKSSCGCGSSFQV
ncbi:iron-sulfur cluster assembly accessory protein [Blastopirellula sp. JC732]|uniref:Iron-sulfur cluster assembly accessory protein n=1 Tax=Blastopirellula sediminis TaxID=2894196 RepID=A0A9X1MLJ3_9BACT|nr:iron-sulfur cluster assembly accessory protein [Blastopirellula sediminis]MCC9608407.1 iron-sulfur cluster assembly accessory protein [Blastopirellula sediminis]MCC9628816.1 iron-sulfur cluster assembly accessory protein [Blastopirellula sediminis]